MITIKQVAGAAGDVAALLIGASLEWLADRTPSERVADAVRVGIAAVLLVLALVAVVGCRPLADTRPGSPVEIDPATVTAEVEVTAVQPSGVIIRG
ncbi:hypothetical protein ACWEFJ_28290 [Actinosynnema sp. NPDC004786]